MHTHHERSGGGKNRASRGLKNEITERLEREDACSVHYTHSILIMIFCLIPPHPVIPSRSSRKCAKQGKLQAWYRTTVDGQGRAGGGSFDCC